jgi:predicted transcriptional regulator
LSNGLQQLSQEASFPAAKACNNFLKSCSSNKQALKQEYVFGSTSCHNITNLKTRLNCLQKWKSIAGTSCKSGIVMYLMVKVLILEHTEKSVSYVM